jgi:hypothetical protein
MILCLCYLFKMQREARATGGKSAGLPWSCSAGPFGGNLSQERPLLQNRCVPHLLGAFCSPKLVLRDLRWAPSMGATCGQGLAGGAHALQRGGPHGTPPLGSHTPWCFFTYPYSIPSLKMQISKCIISH